ncbi:MAG: hypothetical protein Kow0063_10670 [Anaerolineae bacterium]
MCPGTQGILTVRSYLTLLSHRKLKKIKENSGFFATWLMTGDCHFTVTLWPGVKKPYVSRA